MLSSALPVRPKVMAAQQKGLHFICNLRRTLNSTFLGTGPKHLTHGMRRRPLTLNFGPPPRRRVSVRLHPLRSAGGCGSGVTRWQGVKLVSISCSHFEDLPTGGLVFGCSFDAVLFGFVFFCSFLWPPYRFAVTLLGSSLQAGGVGGPAGKLFATGEAKRTACSGPAALNWLPSPRRVTTQINAAFL